MTWIYKSPEEERKFDYSLNIRRPQYLSNNGETEWARLNGFDFSISVDGDCEEVESFLEDILETCNRYREKIGE